MTLLFLPIDINLESLKFERSDNLKKVPPQFFQPQWWDSVLLDESSVKLNLLSVVDQLPFQKISSIMHKFQNQPIGPHYDVYKKMNIDINEMENILSNEPCGYRIVIKGRNDVLKIHDGSKWLTPILPSVPCCYLINSTKLRHMVNDDPGREILYFRGIVDKYRHQELINKSLIKYKEHAVYSTIE